jgi:hypothetical protein
VGRGQRGTAIKIETIDSNLDPDLIWLPNNNSLVDGAGGEPVSPLELVTRPQDPLLLRLLVDLYHGQDLAEHGGQGRAADAGASWVRCPSMKGTFKKLGGSLDDVFNAILVNQVANTLWLGHSDENGRKQQVIAIATAMIGANPADELEGMLVAQLVAAHSGTMECYRRAMLPNQTLDGRDSNLKHAAKLSRVCADLVLACTTFWPTISLVGNRTTPLAAIYFRAHWASS